MKRVVILTGHFPFQKRRGSINWIAHHLRKTGWHVTHATVGYSWISRLMKDRRLQALEAPPICGTFRYSDNLDTIFGYSPIHPVNGGSAVKNNIIGSAQWLFRTYWARKLSHPLKKADLVICESGSPVVLAPILSRYAPNAPRIYRVNDDIALLNAPPYLQKTEIQYAKHFTRISSANKALTKKFSHPNMTIDPMGVPHDLMQMDKLTPLDLNAGAITAVCAGTTQLDYQALSWLSRARPHWQIHVIGRIVKSRAQVANNITYHGELSFLETLRYIASANIGLAPYIDCPGVEYQTSNSNRMLLYRHFGLPILGPDRLCDPHIPTIIGYSDPNALDRCEIMPKQPSKIQDWSYLARALTQNEEIVPPTDVVCTPAISV